MDTPAMRFRRSGFFLQYYGEPPLLGKPRVFSNELLDPYGNSYSFRKAFPFSGLSGWCWLIYQRKEESVPLGLDSF